MGSQNNSNNDADSKSINSDSQPENMKDCEVDGTIDLDYVLENELGQFGHFQLINILLMSIPMMVAAWPMDFVFTAAAIPHRCLIPECGETSETAVYNQESLMAAFPRDANCQRFMPISNNGTLGQCPSTMFNRNRTITCDAIVYDNDHSIVYDFNLGCQNWLRALIGVFSCTGTLLVLPITGYISDRWGRCTALVINIFNSALIAIIRAFSINYPMFLITQFMQTTLGAGIFGCAYILDVPTLSLIAYLFSKFSISAVMMSMYLFTSELYPTQFRHTLVAFSSMIGRIGSILAPLMPVLVGFRLDNIYFFIYCLKFNNHSRCLIPECGETSETAVYNQESLMAAFPRDANCQRFMPISNNGTLGQCPSTMFNRNRTITCDAIVYDNDHSIVYDFNLGCQNWLRALIGVFSCTGTLLVLPITGYISDRWGRCTALVINIFNSALIAIIRAFSINYPMFLITQFMQTTLGAGIFGCAYILATEMVEPKYRVVTGAVCLTMVAAGMVIISCVAWIVQPWRYLIMILYTPTFLLISYYWLLSESVRWLLSQKKYDRAKLILKKVALMNKKQISNKSMQALMTAPRIKMNQEGSDLGLIKIIVKSRVLFRRVCTTPIWWISATLVSYGLSFNSITLPATNMYINYMLTSAIGIPGFFAAIPTLNRIGRKSTLSCGYFLSVICNIIFVFMPDNLPTLSLIAYLFSKFSISAVMMSMYLFTSELYPTQFRHTLVSFSSMIGRIGSILAPLMPVLAEYKSTLPNLLFAVVSIVAGLLVLTQPETLGTKLPDTLAEAEALGKPKS